MNKYRNKKLTQSAKNETCVCHGRAGTTVWAHSDSQKHGKGTGTKAHDIFGAYLCFEAHNDIHNMGNIDFLTKYGAVKTEWFAEMWELSLIIACEKGYL